MSNRLARGGHAVRQHGKRVALAPRPNANPRRPPPDTSARVWFWGGYNDVEYPERDFGVWEYLTVANRFRQLYAPSVDRVKVHGVWRTPAWTDPDQVVCTGTLTDTDGYTIGTFGEMVTWKTYQPYGYSTPQQQRIASNPLLVLTGLGRHFFIYGGPPADFGDPTNYGSTWYLTDNAYIYPEVWCQLPDRSIAAVFRYEDREVKFPWGWAEYPQNVPRGRWYLHHWDRFGRELSRFLLATKWGGGGNLFDTIAPSPDGQAVLLRNWLREDWNPMDILRVDFDGTYTRYIIQPPAGFYWEIPSYSRIIPLDGKVYCDRAIGYGARVLSVYDDQTAELLWERTLDYFGSKLCVTAPGTVGRQQIPPYLLQSGQTSYGFWAQTWWELLDHDPWQRVAHTLQDTEWWRIEYTGVFNPITKSYPSEVDIIRYDPPDAPPVVEPRRNDLNGGRHHQRVEFTPITS